MTYAHKLATMFGVIYFALGIAHGLFKPDRPSERMIQALFDAIALAILAWGLS